ncbi:MAG TPA: sporulation protein YtfJ [Candidatus Latescibacteria bacterium]|nr:sporulation protein YtfJ [Candidatus Latescibacterota bacterium]
MIEVEQLVKTTLAELKQLANTQSVVGEPIQAGNATIIPLVKLGFGFGAGGGSGSKAGDNGTSGGTGAGAGIKPVAVLIITDEGVRLESIPDKAGSDGASGGGGSSTADKVLDLLKIALNKRKGKDTEDPDNTESE